MVRFTLIDDRSMNSIEIVDSLNGRQYVIMGSSEDYDFEELEYLLNILNTGDNSEQESVYYDV